MGKILVGVVNFLRELPEKDIEKVCSMLRLIENKAFKGEFVKNGASKTPYTESLVAVFATPNQRILTEIYKSIESILFVGGCAPGVGIAFNIIDACFCIALNNWIGAFISIISCFPIPGFKLVGKGLQKLIMSLLVKISPNDMLKMFKMLGRQLSKIGFHTNDCYMKIGQKLEEVVEGINNPFAAETIKVLSSAVKKMCRNSNVVKNSVSSTKIKPNTANVGNYTQIPEENTWSLSEVIQQNKVKTGEIKTPGNIKQGYPETYNINRWNTMNGYNMPPIPKTNLY